MADGLTTGAAGGWLGVQLGGGGGPNNAGGSTSESVRRLALVGEVITQGTIVCIDGTIDGPIAPTNNRVLAASSYASRRSAGAALSVPPWDAQRGIIGVATETITDVIPGIAANTGRCLVRVIPGLTLVPGDIIYVYYGTPGTGTNVPQDGFFHIPIGTLKDTNGYNPAGGIQLVWIDLQLQPGPWIPSRWVGYRAALINPDVYIDVDILLPDPAEPSRSVLFETHVAFEGDWSDNGAGGSHFAQFHRTTGYAYRATWEKTFPATVDVATLSDSVYPDVQLLLNGANTHARVRLIYRADLIPNIVSWAGYWSVSVMLTASAPSFIISPPH